MLSKFTCVAVMLSLCACATDLHGQYSGSDSGYLVVALGQTASSNADYSFTFRKSDGSSENDIEFRTKYKLDPVQAMFARDPDFRNQEGAGIVEVKKLPPGDYEFYNCYTRVYTGVGFILYWSKKDFSIPFTIRPGVATYAGHFMARQMMGRDILYIPVAGGAELLLSDKEESDIAIARQPRPNLSNLPIGVPVTDATANPAALKIPVVITDPNAPKENP